MPKTVDFAELGSVDFPDEMSWDEVQSTIRDNFDSIHKQLYDHRVQQMQAETNQEDPPTVADKYVQAARSIGKGAVSGVSGLAKAIGEGAAFINRKVYNGGEPGTVRSGDPKDLTTYRVGKKIEDAANEAWPDVPGLEDSFWFNDVPSGIGQVGGAIATGGAVKAAAGKALAKAGVAEAASLAANAGVGSGLAQMAGSEFDDAYQRSIDRGDSPDLATAKASGYAVLSTAIEAKLGLGRLAKRFGVVPTVGKEIAKTAAESTAKAALAEAAAGFTEESVQRAAQDFIVDGELNLNAAVREGGAGAVVQALLGAAIHPRQRRHAQAALAWIQEKQKSGISPAEVKEAGLKPETLQELGIPVVEDQTGAGGDFTLGEDSAPAATTDNPNALASPIEITPWPQPESAPVAAPVEQVSVEEAPAAVPEAQPSEAAPAVPQAGPGLTPEAATQHVTTLLGGKAPAYLRIYSEPGQVNDQGAPIRGSNSQGAIAINVGNISSPAELEATVLHEAFHNVEQHPDVQGAVQSLSKTILPSQLEELRSRGYSEEEARLEGVAQLLEQEHLSSKQRAAWERLWEATKTALQRSLGWAGVRFNSVDARRILAQSMRTLREDAASGRPRFSLDGQTLGTVLQQTPAVEAPQLNLPDVATKAGKRAIGDIFKTIYGKTITAADGTQVRVENPRYRDWIKFLTHLVSENKTGVYNPNKASWLPLLQHSLENAQMRAVDPNNGDRLYVTQYQQGHGKPTAHIIIVTPQGDLKSFKSGDVAQLQTQFAASQPSRRWKFPVEWMAGRSVGPGPLPRTGPSSQDPGPQTASNIDARAGATVQPPTGPADGQTKFSLGRVRQPTPGEREHILQLQASMDLDATIKERISNFLYNRRSNADDAAFSAEIVHRLGVDQAMQVFRDQVNGLPEAVRTMLGHSIVKTLADAERQARINLRVDEANQLAQRAASFIDQEVLPRSTEVAQALQAFRAFSFLTPSGWIASAKRIIDTARDNKLVRHLKELDGVADGMREINVQTVRKLPKSKSVQEATGKAIEETVRKAPEVQRAVREEAAKSFGNLAGLVLTHFSGQGKVTLAATLKQALGLSAEEAMKKGAQIEAQWKKEVEKFQSLIVPKLKEHRTLWQQYQQSIAGQVVQEVKSKLAGPKRDPALQGFSDRLASVLRAHVEKNLPETPSRPAPKLSPVQVIGEALKNPEKYTEAWQQSLQALREEFGSDAAMMQRLEGVMNQRPDLIAQGTLDKAVGGKLQELRLKIGDVVRRHFLEQTAVGRNLADRLVQEAGVSGDAAVQLAQRVQAQFAQMASTAKTQLLTQMVKNAGADRKAARKSLAQKLANKAGKVIEFTNLGGFSNDAAVEVMAQALGLPSLTPEAKSEISRMASELQQLPEDSHQRQRATVQLMNYISRQKGNQWWELPVSFWYANTLSGPFTHLTNVTSNFLSLGLNMASVLAHHPTSTVSALSAAADGFRRGLGEAKAVLDTGISRQQSTKALAQGPLERMEPTDLKGAGAILSKWKYVGRALAATDQLFYSSAREFKAAVLARGLAQKESLKGEALQVRVRQILGTDSDTRERAQAQAKTEGLTGLDYSRRVWELMDKVRAQDLTEDAHQFALLTTYNGQPYGLLGAIAEGINVINRKTQVSRIVVPFVNVVANVTNESLNFSPVGFARAAWADWNIRKLGAAYLHGAPITNREAIFDAYSKAALGTFGTLALMAMAAAGAGDDNYWFAINGQGPAEPDQRKGLKANGWIPYSLRIRGRYWSFANTPLAIPLGIAGNYLDAVKYQHLDQTDALNRVAYAFGQSGHVITQQSFLDSVMQLAGVLDKVSETKSGDRAVDSLARGVSSMAVPQALRQLDRLFDPTIMQPTTAIERVVAQIPFARRSLKPALNALGEPVTFPPASRWTSVNKDDLLWSALAERQAWPQTPDQGLLTQDEHYTLVAYRGALLRNQLMASLPQILSVPPQESRKLVSKISSEVTTSAKRALGLDRLEEMRKLTQP